MKEEGGMCVAEFGCVGVPISLRARVCVCVCVQKKAKGGYPFW